MCGIVFVSRLDNSSPRRIVEKRYEKQKTRGKSGFGYVAIRGTEVVSYVRREEEAEILQCLRKERKATEILFHHRFPTSTPNVVEGAHPILVKNQYLDYDYYVVHNGIISNDTDLKKEHEKLGFKYTTEMHEQLITSGKNYIYEKQFNDSEAFAIDLALVLEGKQKELESKGSIAFIALRVKKNSGKLVSLHYGRNFSNPLKIEKNKFFLSITSEGEGEIVEPQAIHSYDYNTGKTSKKDISIGSYAYKGQSPYGYNYDREDDDYSITKFLSARHSEIEGKEAEEKLKQAEENVYYLKSEKEDLEARIKKAVELGDVETEADLKIDLDMLESEMKAFQTEIDELTIIV